MKSAAVSPEQAWTIDSRDFTGRGRRIEGEFAGASLERLAEAAEIAGKVRAAVAPWTSPRGRAGLELTAEARVRAQCQRCMRPVALRLAPRARFELVDSADAYADDLSDDWDTLQHDERLDLMQLIEDELLLALPVAPKHEACTPQASMQAGEKVLPFAGLAQWKRPA